MSLADVLIIVALMVCCAAIALLLRRLEDAKQRAHAAEQKYFAFVGDAAAYLVELYNFNGLPMVSFYAAETELSDHIFTQEENVTTARVRVLRLHGAKYRPPPPASPPHPMETVPSMSDRLKGG